MDAEKEIQELKKLVAQLQAQSVDFAAREIENGARNAAVRIILTEHLAKALGIHPSLIDAEIDREAGQLHENILIRLEDIHPRIAAEFDQRDESSSLGTEDVP
jgi:DNA-binding protein YbaB